MKSNILMNCLWYEDITPEDLAHTLELPPGRLFKKIFGDEEFTPEEIHKIAAMLGLTAEETTMIFGNE